MKENAIEIPRVTRENLVSGMEYRVQFEGGIYPAKLLGPFFYRFDEGIWICMDEAEAIWGPVLCRLEGVDGLYSTFLRVVGAT